MDWESLNLNEKSELMKLYLKNGITSLSAMKDHYNSFATGGQMNTDGSKEDKNKKKPDEPPVRTYNIPMVQPMVSVVDNTRVALPPSPIEIAQARAVYETEQRQKDMLEAQRRQSQLKADVRTKQQRDDAYNAAKMQEIKQKANEQAAIFGRALGANHDMTVDEVNENNLNTANLMGYMIAPELMTAFEGPWYATTDRPIEAALTTIPSVVPRVGNIIKNVQFNRSELPRQIIKDVQKVTNENAQRYVQRQRLFGNITTPKETAEFFQPNPLYTTNVRDWFRFADNALLDLFKSSAFNTNNGKVIVINPFSLLKDPREYKGIVAHEAQHSFKYPNMPRVAVGNGKYYGPNPEFPYYNLLKPFEKAASKGRWRGSPDELVSEMANWKYRRHVLDTPFYLLEEDAKKPFIREASKRFKITHDDISTTLEGLSRFGFFNKGGQLK